MPPRRLAARKGATTSTRQMVRTVLDGRQLKLRTTVGDVLGYLAGMDDYHWVIIGPDGAIVLVHKGSTPVVFFAKDCTYAGEPLLETLDIIVGPFRKYVKETYFGRAVSIPENTALVAANTKEPASC